MATQIPDKALQAALAEVEQELREMAKAEQETAAAALRKSREESGSAPSGSAPSPSASASPSAEGSPSGAPPGAEGSAAPSADPAAAGAAPSATPGAPPAADPNAAAGAGAMPTLEQIVAEYSKMPPEELKLYYIGIKTALAQTMGVGGPGAGADPSAGAGAPPPGAAPSAPPSPSAPPMSASAPPMSPMGKSEKDSLLAELKKSEQRHAELSTDIATLSKALEMVVGQPQRKAVTGIEYVRRAPQTEAPAAAAPVEPAKLQKSEMNSKLTQMVRSGKSLAGTKLSKSDMDSISKFSEGGNKDLTLVKHLFAAPAAQ